MDALSDVLKSIRLDGAVYFDGEFTAPWCGQASYGIPHARLREIGADHVIFFHCVTAGTCRARLASGGDEVDLGPGDLVLFPHDACHLLGSDLTLAPMDARRLAGRDDGLGGLLQLRLGGGGASTRLVCGYLCCNRRVSRGLLSSLPEMFSVSLRDDEEGDWLINMLRIAVQESAADRAGAQSILTKLSELLFAESLRRFSDSQPPNQPGWLGGLRDPIVGRALALIHRQPAQAWSVASLASACGSSRSVLAQRFVNLTGQTPMHYMASHRMALAAQHLRAGRQTIAELAIAVGYGSEAAFTRAFKREFDTTPSAWREAGLEDRDIPGASD
ncbi:MAG TPA: AraC family transcriptional regulator [Dokdonella sp.]|nr:AraC family transcriptional regulator [Dokdonella sp.]